MSQWYLLLILLAYSLGQPGNIEFFVLSCTRPVTRMRMWLPFLFYLQKIDHKQNESVGSLIPSLPLISVIYHISFCLTSVPCLKSVLSSVPTPGQFQVVCRALLNTWKEYGCEMKNWSLSKHEYNWNTHFKEALIIIFTIKLTIIWFTSWILRQSYFFVQDCFCMYTRYCLVLFFVRIDIKI